MSELLHEIWTDFLNWWFRLRPRPGMRVRWRGYFNRTGLIIEVNRFRRPYQVLVEEVFELDGRSAYKSDWYEITDLELERGE